jgi:phage terminase large subunit-like protein
MVEGGNRFDPSRVVIHETLDGWPSLRESRGWDLASSSKERDKDDPDWTWGVRGSVRKVVLGHGAVQHEIWIRSMVACRSEAPERDALIRATAQTDGYGVIQHVEAFGAYKDAFTTLRAALNGIAIIRPSRLPGDKSAKLSPLEPSFDARLVHVYAPGCGKFIDMWKSQFGAFPEGKHDDGPDATAVMYHSQVAGGSTMLV